MDTSEVCNNNTTAPDETTLKTLAANSLDINGTKLRVNNISNLSIRSSPTLKHTFVIDFVAKVGPTDDDYYPVSALLKKLNASCNGPAANEFQTYSTLFKDLQLQPNGRLQPHRETLYSLIQKPLLVQKPHLFLENLEAYGYRPVEGKDLLNVDFNHSLLAIETLAKFHATSYFLRRQLGTKGKGKLEMLHKYPFLNQNASIYSPKQSSKLGSVYEQAMELVCKAVESENPSLAFKLRRKVDPASVFDKVVKFLEDEKYENDDFYLACHGNFHAGNLLFKYHNGEPKECRIVNFQSVFFGPMASDLVTFLLTCTTHEFRVEFEEKLLAFYCDAFEEQLLIRNHNDPVEDFDIEEFHRKLERQYKKMLEFGFYNACVLLPLLLFNQHCNNGNNGCLSVVDLLSDTNPAKNYFRKDGTDFQNFVLNNSLLKERMIGILKQLMRFRVLL